MASCDQSLLVFLCLGASALLVGCRGGVEEPRVAIADQVTYHNQVAEIIRNECIDCHRPGGGAPFPLLTYDDVAKRADQIVEVVSSGFMPPWPPDTNVNSFLDERSLSKSEIESLRTWAANGASEGTPNDIVGTTLDFEKESRWSLGKPDLIVSFEQPYEVPAEASEDIYRNFVIPIPVSESRYVEAIEIRPSNLQVAHHLFVRIDQSGAARALSGQDGKPGFGGMERPYGVKPPDGCILSWQVGKQPSREPEGVAWRLYPDSDFVVECHLQPTGKKELVDIVIGLHFTDSPPTRFPILANLRQLDIDIPPGEADYRTTMEYTLPVPAVATAVLPHAHYLGRRLDGYAILPGGKRQQLISIPAWNFNWQGEYRYREPLRLPAGTKIVMDFQFDNSSANPLNPNHPPKRVKYGPQSSDEMAELALQLIPDSRKDYLSFTRDFGRWRIINELIPHELRQLDDPKRNEEERHDSHVNVAKAYFMLGQQNAALNHLQYAAASPSASAEAFCLLGRISVSSKDLVSGKAHFERGLKLDPKNPDALNGLGIVAMREQQYVEAAKYFRKALSVRPKDAAPYRNLGQCFIKLRQYESALSALEAAVRLEPDNAATLQAVEKLRRLVK